MTNSEFFWLTNFESFQFERRYCCFQRMRIAESTPNILRERKSYASRISCRILTLRVDRGRNVPSVICLNRVKLMIGVGVKQKIKFLKSDFFFYCCLSYCPIVVLYDPPMWFFGAGLTGDQELRKWLLVTTVILQNLHST